MRGSKKPVIMISKEMKIGLERSLPYDTRALRSITGWLPALDLVRRESNKWTPAVATTRSQGRAVKVKNNDQSCDLTLRLETENFCRIGGIVSFFWFEDRDPRESRIGVEERLSSSKGELSDEPSCNLHVVIAAALPGLPKSRLLDNDLKPFKNLSICSRTMRQHTFLPLFKCLRVGMESFTTRTAGGKNTDLCLRGMYQLSKFVGQKGLLGKTLGITRFFPIRSHLRHQCWTGFVKKLGKMVLETNPEVLTLHQLNGALR